MCWRMTGRPLHQPVRLSMEHATVDERRRQITANAKSSSSLYESGAPKGHIHFIICRDRVLRASCYSPANSANEAKPLSGRRARARAQMMRWCVHYADGALLPARLAAPLLLLCTFKDAAHFSKEPATRTWATVSCLSILPWMNDTRQWIPDIQSR